MASIAQMLLYHGLDETGLLQVSTTSGAGPWTDLRLTETRPVEGALAEWEALAEAAFPGADFTFHYDPGNDIINFWRLDGSAWFRHTATLQYLLGQVDQVTSGEDGGFQVAVFGSVAFDGFPSGRGVVARGAVLDEEHGELEELRGGRCTTYHSARAKEVAIELYVPENARTDERLASPLCAGHCAMSIARHDPDDYPGDSLDGVVVVYPYETPNIVRLEGTDDWVRVELKTTVQDAPAAAPIAIGTSRWSRYMAAVRFGYKPFYVLWVEGCPYLFTELTGITLLSTDYTTAPGTLVIDKGARLGPVLSDKTNFAAANHLEVRLADPTGTSIVADLMRRPTTVTTLSADFAAGDTDLDVVSARGFESAGVVYFGTSFSEVLGALHTNLTVDTSLWGPDHNYKAGTVVADRPRQWGGRRVELWLMLMTPAGQVLQVAGDEWHEHGICRFAGYIQSRPIRERGLWRLQAQDQVRRLAQPLSVGASGSAVWELDDDGARTIDLDAAVTIRAYHNNGAITLLGEYTLQPWTSGANPMRLSEIRSRLSAAWKTAVAADADFGGASAELRWEQRWYANLPATGRRWVPLIDIVPPASSGSIRTEVRVTGRVPPFTVGFAAYAGAELGRAELALSMRTDIVGAALSVTLEDGDPAALPTSGWVRLTTNGQTEYFAYSGLTIDPVDGSKVILDLDESSSPDLQRLAGMEGTEVPEVSAEFVWRQDGSAGDVLRRAIVSSGHGANGAYDVLATGQGYGLPDIDAPSFDNVFDGAYRRLPFQLAAEGGVSLERLFSGILRLSQRGLAGRRAADGSAMQIAAVRVGSPDSGVPVATITDADLVAQPGSRPVRVKGTYVAPQAIAISCATIPIADRAAADARITTRDPHLEDWTGTAWDLTVYGVERDALAAPAVSWSTELYRGAENRQVLEIDVRPDVDAQVGDIIELRSHDAHLWDYALGTTGYTGLARVLGNQGSLDALHQTLTVAVDGIMASGPFCPSLEIVAVNGTVTSPTSVDVAEEHYTLLVRAQNGAATFGLLAYLPGTDGGRALYTFSAVTLTAGVCRLTTATSPTAPTVSLSTSYRLTYPPAASCTETQAAHLHNTDVTQWT